MTLLNQPPRVVRCCVEEKPKDVGKIRKGYIEVEIHEIYLEQPVKIGKRLPSTHRKDLITLLRLEKDVA